MNWTEDVLAYLGDVEKTIGGGLWGTFTSAAKDKLKGSDNVDDFLGVMKCCQMYDRLSRLKQQEMGRMFAIRSLWEAYISRENINVESLTREKWDAFISGYVVPVFGDNYSLFEVLCSVYDIAGDDIKIKVPVAGTENYEHFALPHRYEFLDYVWREKLAAPDFEASLIKSLDAWAYCLPDETFTPAKYSSGTLHRYPVPEFLIEGRDGAVSSEDSKQAVKAGA